MATTFNDIIDMALITIQDYKLNEMYTTNQSDFETITEGFLLRGLPKFNTCRQSLDYDLETKSFVSTFTKIEISILSDLWVEEWFEFQVNNVTQFNGKMTTNDFKHYSEAENLKQKSDYLDRLREKRFQEMTNYDYADNCMWQNWANGIFF